MVSLIGLRAVWIPLAYLDRSLPRLHVASNSIFRGWGHIWAVVDIKARLMEENEESKKADVLHR